MKKIFLKILVTLGALLIAGGSLTAVGLEKHPMEEFNYILPYCYLSSAIGALLLIIYMVVAIPPCNNYRDS